MSDGMVPDQKPGVCFVVGGWHLPLHFEVIKSKLEALGYLVVVPKPPTCSENGNLSWKDDVAEIQREVAPYMDQGKEFIIVGHSYGGVPACAATQGYTTIERAESGKKGGFRSILFISAVILPKAGMDILQLLGGSYPPFLLGSEPYTKNQLMRASPEEARGLFFSDLSDEEAEKYVKALSPQAQNAFETPVDFVPSQLKIPATYLVCELDCATPLPMQEQWLSEFPWMKIERCSSGHSPFINKPDRVIEILEKM